MCKIRSFRRKHALLNLRTSRLVVFSIRVVRIVPFSSFQILDGPFGQTGQSFQTWQHFRAIDQSNRALASLQQFDDDGFVFERVQRARAIYESSARRVSITSTLASRRLLESSVTLRRLNSTIFSINPCFSVTFRLQNTARRIIFGQTYFPILKVEFERRG